MHGLLDVAGLEVDEPLGLAGFKLAGRFTVLDLADLHRLLTLGPGVRWTTGTSCGHTMPMLRFRDRGPVMVARVILGATDWQTVGYRNGDRFDLRRCNLLLHTESRRHPKRWPMPHLAG
jgi:hypothetical protein